MATQASAQTADLILAGGRIWTGPGSLLTAREGLTALAVRSGRVVAVGSDSAILALTGAGTRRVPLNGRRVVPGLIDNHTHFLAGGFTLAGVQLRDAATPQEFIRRVGQHVAANPESWVVGGTWDHELWGGDLPRRDWIDSVSGATPVFVQRLDGHMGLANSRALVLAGISAGTADPPGGAIVRTPNGDPTGILKDEAQSLVERVIPPPSGAERDRALRAAVDYALAHGVTLVTDMGSWDNLATYRRAHARGDLRVRVYSVVPLASWQRLAELVRREGRGDDRLAWGGLKAFVDGSLGSTTAWFYQPYADASETRGLVVTDTTQLRRWIVDADAAGLHVMVHAIGDRANDWLLDTYRDARSLNGLRDRRFRIEHAQHLTAAAIRRLGAEGVTPSMQPYHAIDDGRWAEKRIGRERCETTYAFRSLFDAGARVTFGSDWTVAPMDPIQGIYAAVTRRTLDGANPGGWVPSQRINVEEALLAYTVNNAYASYRENVLGTLDVGKYADLVVLSEDILAIPPEEISQVRVDMTMIEGEIVFER